MDAKHPWVTRDGKPTRQLMAAVNELRVTATDPSLSGYARVVDADGKPTRAFAAILAKLKGITVKASAVAIDPVTGKPTRALIEVIQ